MLLDSFRILVAIFFKVYEISQIPFMADMLTRKKVMQAVF